MESILTYSEQQAIKQIDQLLTTYCHQCPLKSHIRKTENKTQAHHFCINECSIGKQIKQIGNELQ
ncbi:zinc-finger domain-containing protein [Staphylococcus warneri]|uniref:zinc-finger domain-containing protein n=1 Tax=Staphylococcus warneri TaxID=1292 RepID=UPI000D1D4469|nr:zinc-finger domain-containing protein [Staphylococcus warneri]PTI84731.1 zinc-finger domain-containing protein [Staphylococcus warneri]